MYLEFVMFLHMSIVVCPNQNTLAMLIFGSVRLNFMLTVVSYPPMEFVLFRVSEGNVRAM